MRAMPEESTARRTDVLCHLVVLAAYHAGQAQEHRLLPPAGLQPLLTAAPGAGYPKPSDPGSPAWPHLASSCSCTCKADHAQGKGLQSPVTSRHTSAEQSNVWRERLPQTVGLQSGPT